MSNIVQLDPLLSLALAIQTTPGGYAVLAGSGLSRAAGVPTGWEIVLDLIRTLAALEGEQAVAAMTADPEGWYQTRFGQPPSYSRLLEQVAGTGAERRALLRKYFEPTPEEIEQGLKVPTRAHVAIARMVRGGFVRVIITTNFDQLLETALRAEGVTPAVLSTADAVEGMVPLHLAPATLIKLHGDYLDTRVKNTPEELEYYDPRVLELLDRVLDEYGLVVCGWSATWDPALRSAIERVKSRRFTTFWTTRGPPSEESLALISHRQAQAIDVESADDFFDRLAEKVETLDSIRRPHPLSTAVAVATLKRYLPVPEQRIRLHDLLQDEVERTMSQALSAINPTIHPSGEAVFAAMTQIEGATETLAALAATGSFWGVSEQRHIWVSLLEQIATAGASLVKRAGSQYEIWESLYRYPVQLVFYAAALGAIARGADGEETLLDLLLKPRLAFRPNAEPVAPVMRLYAGGVVSNDTARTFPGTARRLTPISDHLFNVMRPILSALIPDDDVYAALFDRFEYLISLAYLGNHSGELQVGSWVPVGRLAWRRESMTHRSTAADQVSREIEVERENWLLLRRGQFGGSLARIATAQELVLTMLQRRGDSW